jgi:thiamine biosynthesis lipoprotein
LQQSQSFSQKTCGALDVTVGPYVRLWRRSRQQGWLPSAERLANARNSVGYEKIRLDASSRSVQLLAPEMWLDLGGIAVGYAVDEAVRVLARAGIRHALVDAGGDIAALDPPPGTDGWRVALASCAAEQAPAREFIGLRNGAITTSGDTYRYVEIAGQRYSHIIDPKTGLGLTSRLVVSVCAPDCMTADGLATAMSVLGTEKSLALARGFLGVSVRICDMQAEPAKVYTTGDFPRCRPADDSTSPKR